MPTRVLVTDLDNTVWDWFEAWHGSFAPMLEELVRASGVSRSILEAEIHEVHQRRGTVEYSNLLDELPSLRNAIPAVHASEYLAVWPHYQSALDILRSRRRSSTRLYPGVLDTLTKIKAAGITVIAYTESLAYWTEWRIRHTGLDGIIDVLYSSPDHDLPLGMSTEDLRSRPDDYYGLERTQQRQVPRGVLKPNPEVLLQMLRHHGFRSSQAAYIGDSLMKDITMAQAAGVLDVHAKFGEAQMRPEYDLLRRVTHWPRQDVDRERELTTLNRAILPTYTCERSYSELLVILGLETTHG